MIRGLYFSWRYLSEGELTQSAEAVEFVDIYVKVKDPDQHVFWIWRETAADGEAPLLEFWRCKHSLPLPARPLWTREVVPVSNSLSFLPRCSTMPYEWGT